MTRERLEQILLEANNIAVLCGLIAWLKSERARELYRQEASAHVTRLFSMCGLKGR